MFSAPGFPRFFLLASPKKNRKNETFSRLSFYATPAIQNNPHAQKEAG
jgi:hypothetical protein